jgi:hypothetical protein
LRAHLIDSTSAVSTRFFRDRWNFDVLGDIQKIWRSSGEHVHVRIYDDGLEYTHADLAANYDPSR